MLFWQTQEQNIIFTNPKQAFLDAESAKNEGYYFIHPFDGPLTLQGSATLGLEIVEYLKSRPDFFWEKAFD